MEEHAKLSSATALAKGASGVFLTRASCHGSTLPACA